MSLGIDDTKVRILSILSIIVIIILTKVVLKSSRCGTGGMDWINLAQNGERWLALVNEVMNLWVP
jgi:hypothetical protein